MSFILYLCGKNMRKEDLAVIEDALNSALHLISNEMQCVIDDELSNEYQQVIDQLDNALQLFPKE